MKLSITFKTPDAVANAVNDAYEFSDDDDYEDKVYEVSEKLKKWVSYGELVTIEFDLEAGTAEVKERS